MKVVHHADLDRGRSGRRADAIPVIVPVLVGVVVLAGAVGVGLLLKSPETKSTEAAKEKADVPVAPSPKPINPRVANKPGSTPSPAPQGASPVVGLQIGNLAPDISGEDADGNKFKLSDYRGKVVVLDFWANW
jgi:hypothetical protein